MTSMLFNCGQFWCGHSGAERWYKIWGIWKKLGLLTIFFVDIYQGKTNNKVSSGGYWLFTKDW